MENIEYYASPLGRIVIASDSSCLHGLWFEGQKYFPASISGAERKPNSITELVSGWLDLYFDGKKPEISRLPLEPQGSEFRRNVWGLLCLIPYGRVTTYGEIAAELARRHGLERMSAQAVGGAVGHNPISIIIPCHRVIGSGGALTGYAGGLDRKSRLLSLEQADTADIFRF